MSQIDGCPTCPVRAWCEGVIENSSLEIGRAEAQLADIQFSTMANGIAMEDATARTAEAIARLDEEPVLDEEDLGGLAARYSAHRQLEDSTLSIYAGAQSINVEFTDRLAQAVDKAGARKDVAAMLLESVIEGCPEGPSRERRGILRDRIGRLTCNNTNMPKDLLAEKAAIETERTAAIRSAHLPREQRPELKYF